MADKELVDNVIVTVGTSDGIVVNWNDCYNHGNGKEIGNPKTGTEGYHSGACKLRVQVMKQVVSHSIWHFFLPIYGK